MISAKAFAAAVGITPQAAREAFRVCSTGGSWRGKSLPVHEVPGNRGGARGKVWALRSDLCSPELRNLLGLSETLPSTSIEDRLQGRAEDWQIAAAVDKYRILTPVLLTRPGSPERANAIRDLAAQPAHQIGGTWTPVAERTLYDWLSAAEGNLSGLLPSGRSDRGVARVLMTRLWDATIDLADGVKAEIAARITRKAQSMAANDGTSDREIIRLCGLRLEKYCVSAGSQLPAAKLKGICKLNTKWAARLDLGRFRLVHMRDKDHKAWQDKAVPRIRRKLHDTPMGLLIGDVHYVDMLVTEALASDRLELIGEGVSARAAGQETIRVRLIAWLDTSSLFVWATPVFLSKGKGITQADVAESLSQVAFCPHGGIPLNYYLDNGSEYDALASAMVRLANLAEMQFGVTLAKPYSPTSKGEIEGYFNILEGILKGLPGWIGGDRTDKKTQNKGQVVQPYTKGLAALEADIIAAVAIYNSRAQGGRLAGVSPLDMLERNIADTGFVARVPSEEAFDLIFSRSVSRTIQQGTIRYDNRQWHTPAIDDLPVREQVEILIPLRKQCDRVFVRHAGKPLGWAEPLPEFEHGDRDGARLQARLEKGRDDAVKHLRTLIDPAISTFDLQKAAVDRIAPNAPAPETWAIRAIDKTGQPSSVAELDAAEDARRRADLEEFLAFCGGQGERPAGATADPSRAT